MKKLSYILGCCVALFSCTREIEKIEPETIEYPNVAEVNDLPTNIPSTLIANLAAEDEDSADTRTAYEGGKSKWVLGDRVCLLYVDNLASPSNQGWIAYSVTALENEDRMATFTIESGQDSKITALSSYKSTGVAIYPSNAARPYTANTEAINGDYDHKPFITIQTTQSGSYSDVVMLGKTAVVDGSTMTVDFKNAMSILKVTVTDIPASAAKFQLYSSDVDVYPTGDFLIDINAAAPLELTKNSYHTWGGGKHSGDQAITVNRTSAWDDGTEDFYFNVPTGAYSAGTITLQLLDGTDKPLMEKPIKSNFTFERNKMITGISLAAEWTGLGTGKFIDNFLWAKITSDGYNTTVGRDVPGYVNVTIQQSLSDPNTFRLVNPYGTAAIQFGYTSANAANRDNYLVFTVEGADTGDAVTDYVTHRTGYAIDSGHYNPELVYPTTYDAGYDASYNKVLVGDGTLPKIVQFAPVYRYNGSSTAYNYASHGMKKHGVFRIVFPGVTNIGGSLNLPASGDAQLNKLEVVKQSNSYRFRGVVSQYTDYEIAAPNVNSYYVDNGHYPGIVTGANGTCTWNNTGLATSSTLPSGPVYLTWYTVDADNVNCVYDQGCTKVYYINATDYAKYVKSHTFTYGQTSEAGEWKYGTIAFALSDDPTKGQLILTDVDGLTSVASNTRLAAAHPLWTAMGTWLAHGTGAYAYASDRVTDGNTYYGTIDGSKLSFATNANFEFFNYSVDGVSGHTAKIILFSNDASTSDVPSELAFDISDTKLTLAHDYLVARFVGWFFNGSTVTNSGGRASKPLAQKVSDSQRAYISLE